MYEVQKHFQARFPFDFEGCRFFKIGFKGLFAEPPLLVRPGEDFEWLPLGFPLASLLRGKIARVALALDEQHTLRISPLKQGHGVGKLVLGG